MSTLQCVLVVVICVCRLSVLASTATDLCDNRFCACVKDTSGLLTLNCTFGFQQDLILSEHSLAFEDFSSIKLSNLHELIVSPSTFNRNNWKNLKLIKFENINKLNLQPHQYYGNSSLIHLHNVSILEIPSNAFSVLSQLHISASHIHLIRRNAFSALHIPSILIENTSIHHVEMAAFSERTLLSNLRLTHVQLKVLDSNALVSAINKLSIEHSNITDIYSGGINITVASVQVSNNIISNIHESGIILNNWNYIIMENNTFKTLQPHALSIYNTEEARYMAFKFVGNALGETYSESLNFRFGELRGKSNRTERLNINISVNENYFVKTCYCDFYNFVKDTVNADFARMFYDTSYCNINIVLSQCFKKPQGLLNVKNFTDTICVQNIVCNTKTSIETTKTRLFPGLTSTFDLVFDGNENEDILVRYVCVALVILMLVILLCTICLFVKQSHIFSKVKSNIFMTLYSKLCSRKSSSKCPTKTKMFSNDYSELNKHLHETKIDMTDITLDNQINYDHVYINKATQTLPEELTQELLQNLRVKLEDPNEYCLARDMIEHLYDLIKIEENCNRNVNSTVGENHYMSTAIGDKHDNIYDEIEIHPSKDTSKSKQHTPLAALQREKPPYVLSTFQCFPDRTLSPPIIRNNKKFVNVGTRAPSPDKLLPYDFPSKKVTLLEEYQMPRDNNSSFIYCELPPNPDATPLSRDQLRLLDEMNDAINIYIDTSLRGSHNDVYFNRPLPSKPDA